jgi:hypothetical protein
MKRERTKSNPNGLCWGDIIVPNGAIKTTQGYNMSHIIEAKVTGSIWGDGTADILVTKGQLFNKKICYASMKGFKLATEDGDNYEIF